MRFTFNETQLINLLLWMPDKYKFIRSLSNYEKEVDDKELKGSLTGLIKKVNKLTDDDIKRLYNDRINYQTKTFPQYELKKL